MEAKASKKKKNILLRIKVFHAKILVPYEDIIIRSNYVRMKKPLGVPPSGLSESCQYIENSY